MKKITMVLALCSVAAFANAADKIIHRKISAESTGVISAFVLPEGQKSFVQFSGEAAQKMYEALDVPARNSDDGAGPTTFFKRGQSYECYAEAKNPLNPQADQVYAHACGFSFDPGSGKIK